MHHAFLGDQAVVNKAIIALVLVGLAQVPTAIAFVLDGVLIGSSDFKFLNWNMLAVLAVFMPFALAVLRWHGLGIVGVWVGILVWMLFRAAVNGARFRGPSWIAGAGLTGRPAGDARGQVS